METEKEAFLGHKTSSDENATEYYMNMEPPPAYMEVYTISDKVPALAQSPNLRRVRNPMFDSPRKRLLFVSILTFGSLLLSILILLGFQKYISHPDGRHSKINRIKGSYQVILPHEMFPNKRDNVPYRLDEEVELTESYGYVSTDPFDHFGRSAVLHEFDKRLTVVRSEGKCLIKPMRSDFRPPTEWERLTQAILTNSLMPRVRCVREYWYMVAPAIPAKVLLEKYGSRIASHCDHDPAFRLLSREDFMGYLIRSVTSDSSDDCFSLPCKTACPEGTAHELDSMGCLKDCKCRPIVGRQVSNGKICAELNKENCSIHCEDGYALNIDNNCPICRCDEVASKRKRRNIPHPEIQSYMKNCNITMEVFEGMLAGDEQKLGTLDYIYRCSA